MMRRGYVFQSRKWAAWLVFAILLAQLAALQATPHRPVRLAKFAARYIGGYSVTSPAGNAAGPASIRIRAPKDGRSASMTWTNTFYNAQGSYRVTLRWNFLPGGAIAANSLDPRAPLAAQPGSYLFSGRTIVFNTTSATGVVTAKGELAKVGGGAISITVTLTGLPEGEVTYGFSGGRKR